MHSSTFGNPTTTTTSSSSSSSIFAPPNELHATDLRWRCLGAALVQFHSLEQPRSAQYQDIQFQHRRRLCDRSLRFQRVRMWRRRGRCESQRNLLRCHCANVPTVFNGVYYSATFVQLLFMSAQSILRVFFQSGNIRFVCLIFRNWRTQLKFDVYFIPNILRAKYANAAQTSNLSSYNKLRVV